MLRPNKLNRLKTIFRIKKWDTDDSKNKLFERFSTALSKLEEEDQDFILQITEHFNTYGLSDYGDMLEECLNKMNEEKFFDGKKIIVAPLLPFCQKDEYTKNVKSSNFMCYLMKSNNLSYLDYIIDQNMAVVNYLEEKDVKEIIDGQAKLLLIDDYIGSGGTLLATIKTYTSLGIDIKYISVLSLIIDNLGEEKLKGLQIDYYNSTRPYNKVSDVIDDSVEISKFLNKIGKKVSTKRYYHGYNKTLALVSMVRTPNNTIPFYWSERKNKAPFPRFNEKR